MNQPMEPYSHESEQGVLGGIMIASRNGDHDRITAVTKLVKAESFYSSIPDHLPGHKRYPGWRLR